MELIYDDADCNRFVSDMVRQGRKPRHLFLAGWTGPAVDALDLPEALALVALTDVRCTREPLSDGAYIVRPLARGQLTNDPDTPAGTSRG